MPETSVSVPSRAVPSPLVAPARRLVRAAGFWLAVALPLVYLPMAVLTPSFLADPTVLGGVIVVNLLAVALGHRHEPVLGAPRRAD